MKQVAVAIIGASGYSGQELIRLLLRHPGVRITQFTSRQYAGRSVAEVFPRFAGEVQATFTEPRVADIDAEAVFLALPHGVAAEYAAPLLQRGVRVLDLSADFRLKSPATYKEFYGQEHPAPELLATAVYGLPERYREQIRQARLVACPGCYPTSIILGVLPVLPQAHNIVVASLSGVSGAGRKVAEEYLFAECNESTRAYGIPKHRHLSEIEEQLGQAITFVPHLIPLNRGILSTICMEAALADPLPCYRQFYRNEPFVRVTDSLPDTKNVALTNYCDISARFDSRTNRLIVVSAIDNLTKGAAGQAVQCFNLMYGFDETTGLL